MTHSDLVDKTYSFQQEKPAYDRWLLFSSLGIIIVGLLMVASASMVISEKQYNTPFHYIVRQTIYLILGAGFCYAMLHVSSRLLQKYCRMLLIAAIFLLILVLIPGISHEVNGSTRWIGVGFLNFQGSELAKLCLIIYLASYLQRYQREVQSTIMGFIKPIMLLSVAAGLLLLEPDFGAAVVMMATALGMMFLAGVRLRHFASLFIVVIIIMAVLAITSPYRVQRLTSFLNPWENQFGSGYQLTQSLIAFGRGGLFGVGLGNSLQKLFYLPEAHTDFLFAVLAEELGLAGVIGVLGLFTIFISRIFLMAKRAYNQQETFIAFLTYGIGLSMAFQVMINIGVSSGLLPTKGLTLPLMSYGGSSLLINFIILGILLRIDREIKLNFPHKTAGIRGSIAI